jgi:hypothetical protein
MLEYLVWMIAFKLSDNSDVKFAVKFAVSKKSFSVPNATPSCAVYPAES